MKKSIKNLAITSLVIASLFILNQTHAQSNRGDTIKTGKTNDPMVVDPGQNKDQMNVNTGKTNDAMAVMTDTGFLTKNIADNQLQIGIAKMGASKGNAMIKKIAGQLITSHTIIMNDFKKIAAQKGAKYSSETMPSIPSIKVNPGSDFNITWASAMLTLEDQKLSELEKYAAIAADKDVKALIERTLPKIKNDLFILAKVQGAKSHGNSMIH